MRRHLLLLLALLFTSDSEAKKRPISRPPPAVPPAASPEPVAPTAPTTSIDGAATRPAPASTPEAASPSPAAPPPPAPAVQGGESRSAVDLESLSAEYNAIRDELFRSRAKATMLGDALFKTQITVYLRYEAQRAWPLKKVTLKLDDRPVYAADSLEGNEWIRLWGGVASPGRHTLSAHVEAGAVGSARVAYATDGTFLFDLVDSKQTRVRIALDETGSGPQTLGQKKEGSFDLRLKAEIKILDRGAK